MSYKEKKQLQIDEVKSNINLWENKLRFSLNSVFVFLSFFMHPGILIFLIFEGLKNVFFNKS